MPKILVYGCQVRLDVVLVQVEPGLIHLRDGRVGHILDTLSECVRFPARSQLVHDAQDGGKAPRWGVGLGRG